jgi:hypothetical protein
MSYLALREEMMGARKRRQVTDKRTDKEIIDSTIRSMVGRCIYGVDYDNQILRCILYGDHHGRCHAPVALGQVKWWWGKNRPSHVPPSRPMWKLTRVTTALGRAWEPDE